MAAVIFPLIIAWILGGEVAHASPPAGQVSFSAPSLFPTFSPDISDYVVRCNDQPVDVDVHTSPSWRAAINNEPFRTGDFSETVPLSAGLAFTVTVAKVGSSKRDDYHVRCLPSDFPAYGFARYGPVSPKLFAVDHEYSATPSPYGIIFDGHGVPLWWYPAQAKAFRVLPDESLLWANRFVSPNDWEIHSLDGALVRTLTPVGRGANPHDFQYLRNGGYQLGSYVKQHPVDTSAYGGLKNATVVNAELQQVDSDGNLVWDWKSEDHISLAETPKRMWRWVVHHPAHYDITHWNSIQPDGDAVIASFRNLDAVYKIRKSTGNIIWKLGGTKTSKSLTVIGDPHSYVLGAQHDARLLPDGTLTVFNNRTNLKQRRPEAERFRINQRDRTATLLDSISDPSVSASSCCGSARRLGNGDWLIDWGQVNGIGGYKPDGQRTFFFRFWSGISYRAEPVPNVVSRQDLREAMDAMCSSGCG